MDIDLDELERLARSATPGPWEHEVVQDVHAIAWIGNIGVFQKDGMPHRDWAAPSRDAEFISFSNPSVVLELIRRLREAESVLKPKRTKKAKATFDAVACLMSHGVTEEAAQAWVANRKTPLTELAIKLTIGQAEKAGYTLQMAVEEVVLRGWQGFKADYVRDTARFCRTAPAKSSAWEDELIGRDNGRTINVTTGDGGACIQAANRRLR